MIRHGAAPFIECSSMGVKCFSAFFAKVLANGKFDTIENHYQAFKIFADGRTGLSWREAKGQKAVNQEAAAKFYSQLWDQYIRSQPDMLEALRNCSGLQDTFGQAHHCCQATELWRIKLADQEEL